MHGGSGSRHLRLIAWEFKIWALKRGASDYKDGATEHIAYGFRVSAFKAERMGLRNMGV